MAVSLDRFIYKELFPSFYFEPQLNSFSFPGFLSRDLAAENVQSQKAKVDLDKVTLQVYLSSDDLSYILGDNGNYLRALFNLVMVII